MFRSCVGMVGGLLHVCARGPFVTSSIYGLVNICNFLWILLTGAYSPSNWKKVLCVTQGPALIASALMLQIFASVRCLLTLCAAQRCVKFKAWPAINTLFDEECLRIYFLPRPSSDYCLPVMCPVVLWRP